MCESAGARRHLGRELRALRSGELPPSLVCEELVEGGLLPPQTLVDLLHLSRMASIIVGDRISRCFS
eukprot:6179983-Pleurochrysis_carterae.AAC.2